MWLRTKVRGWHSRSGFDKIDLYTRGTLYSLVWITVLSQSLLTVRHPVRGSDAPAVLIIGMVLTAIAQGICGTSLAARAIEGYLGRRTVDRRFIGLGFVLMLANAASVLVLGSYTGVDRFPELVLALCASVVPFLTSFVLLVPLWAIAPFVATLSAALSGGAALAGGDASFVLGTLIGSAFSNGLIAVTVRLSAWTLGVMAKLRDAQDMETRLAVAEERLRFGRDMHDVLGRNLAVIALKSELAVELAQRGNPAAMDQMVEVQRIARTSQQEVRDVVRGYREADLRTELAGAQGVLRAAGIACDIEDRSGGRLAPPVQAALGWVVREAATNVLRHGDPRRCTIRLTNAGGTGVLVVENDGVPDGAGPPSGGSGLAGLRERLAALGGSLEAGPVGGGLFRLTASVPGTPSPPHSPSPLSSSPPSSAQSPSARPSSSQPSSAPPSSARPSSSPGRRGEDPDGHDPALTEER
ncbi:MULTISPECIES: sensor histidine kinase [unclassified Streptomyces]|uniref:sensor histidine kinase n=1 Tax=unclassified Streptomyces TaxID=2593676 RepID=UPI00093A97BB|nr:histidine kinase [Streptomyces sp. TSRI0281]OKI42138.1 histidine kinase [Streptomyces sp. TSRI0281]